MSPLGRWEKWQIRFGISSRNEGVAFSQIRNTKISISRKSRKKNAKSKLTSQDVYKL